MLLNWELNIVRGAEKHNRVKPLISWSHHCRIKCCLFSFYRPCLRSVLSLCLRSRGECWQFNLWEGWLVGWCWWWGGCYHLNWLFFLTPHSSCCFLSETLYRSTDQWLSWKPTVPVALHWKRCFVVELCFISDSFHVLVLSDYITPPCGGMEAQHFPKILKKIFFFFQLLYVLALWGLPLLYFVESDCIPSCSMFVFLFACLVIFYNTTINKARGLIKITTCISFLFIFFPIYYICLLSEFLFFFPLKH